MHRLTDEEKAAVAWLKAMLTVPDDLTRYDAQVLLALLTRLLAPPPLPPDVGAWWAAVEARLGAATAGPWRAEGGLSANAGSFVVADDGPDSDPLAVTEVFGQPDSMREANAALIAFAPTDLAHALALVAEAYGLLIDAEDRAGTWVDAERARIAAWLRERADEVVRDRQIGHVALRWAADLLDQHQPAPPSPVGRLRAENARLRDLLRRLVAWRGAYPDRKREPAGPLWNEARAALGEEEGRP